VAGGAHRGTDAGGNGGERGGGAVRAACIAALVLVGIAALALAGIAAFGAPVAARSGAAPGAPVARGHAAPATDPDRTAPTPVPSFRSVRTYRSVAVPVRLRIPSIGVDTGLVRLGLAADGSIAAPTRWEVAGWYEKGPRPGQPAPAVIAGHVDSHSGPAVFYRLRELRPGARVYVERADGSTIRFRVTESRRVAKSAFPADLVYSPTLQPVLRLVTCGGTFDTTTGHYRDNIVVSAEPG
jgi:sortase (surface protein transpeptidase)